MQKVCFGTWVTVCISCFVKFRTSHTCIDTRLVSTCAVASRGSSNTWGNPAASHAIVLMKRSRSVTPPWRQGESHASDSGHRLNRSKTASTEHWKHTVYVTMVWGTHLDYQVEAFLLGLCLQRTSTKRRILYASPDLLEHGLTGLLGSVWELREFQSVSYTHLTLPTKRIV